MEYASNAKGNLGVTLGAIGTGLSALASSNGLDLLNSTSATEDKYVTKEILDLQLQLIDSKKDNAILTADLSSEKKMVEVFNAANDKINTVRDELVNEIRTVEAKVDGNAASQAVINAQYGSQINLNTSQISQLFGLTKLVVPNTSVCPGWGNVQISPTTSTGTTIA